MSANTYLEFVLFDPMTDPDLELRERILGADSGVVVIRHFLGIELRKGSNWNLWSNQPGVVIASARANEEGRRKMVRLCNSCDLYMEDLHCIYFSCTADMTQQEKIVVGNTIHAALQNVMTALEAKHQVCWNLLQRTRVK